MLSGDVPAARKVIGALLPARRYRGVSSIWRECIPHRTPHGGAHRDRPAHTVEVPSGMCWARRASQMVAFIYELLM